LENLIGRNIDRYQIVDQIGVGGMAVVYKARDARLDRLVAIKVIRKGQIRADDLPQLLQRFDREAHALAHLSHPNIVKIHDYGKFEGMPYFVMEYLAGGTLKSRMTERVPWAQSARLLAPIAAALQYAHKRGIIHRDVKPANVLLTETGQALLSDFGIAKLLENVETSGLTEVGGGIGTPEYMAPEQWVGQAVPQTDVYALGIVLYQMITGRLPHEADTPAAMLIKHINEPLTPPKELVPDLPGPVETVILKALSKKPEGRASMDDLAADLERLAGGPAALYQRRPTPILDRLYDRLTSEPTEAGSGTKPAVADEAATVVSAAPPTILARLDQPTELAKPALQPLAETVLGRPPEPVDPVRPSPHLPRWVWVVAVLAFLAVEALIVAGVYILARMAH